MKLNPGMRGSCNSTHVADTPVRIHIALCCSSTIGVLVAAFMLAALLRQWRAASLEKRRVAHMLMFMTLSDMCVSLVLCTSSVAALLHSSETYGGNLTNSTASDIARMEERVRDTFTRDIYNYSYNSSAGHNSSGAALMPWLFNWSDLDYNYTVDSYEPPSDDYNYSYNSSSDNGSNWSVIDSSYEPWTDLSYGDSSYEPWTDLSYEDWWKYDSYEVDDPIEESHRETRDTGGIRTNVATALEA